MKKIDQLNGKEHDEILHTIYRSDYFFRASLEQLSRHFIGTITEIPVFSMSFDDLRKLAISHMNDPSPIPEKEADFYKYICQHYLDIEKEPAGVMLEYYRNATTDLKILEIRISEYERLITDIADKEPGMKTEEDIYKQRLLNHYKETNQSAHREILDFLFYRIEDYTIFNCTNRPWLTSLIYAGIPYSFRVLSRQLQWESLSDLSNKFLDVTIEKHKEMDRLYKENLPAFYVATKKYIEEKKIIEKIQGVVAGNHCLDLRKRVFDEAFDAYTKGNKYLFCSVIALQIEGLFADYCIELGIDGSSIRSGSLTDKVRMATQKNNRYRSFEYYAFRFPLIRNKIAHGNIITDDVNDLSDYLLLDLFDVCLSLTSLSLPVNKVVSILRQWKDVKSEKRLEVKYCLFRDITVPSFYKLSEVETEIKESIIDRSFWDYLLYLIDSDHDMLKKGVFKIVTSLKRASINEPWCKELFEKLTGVTIDGFDEAQFLDELNSM